MEETQHSESSVKIYWTTQYGNFKWLKGNREINEAKVKKIIKDIEAGIDLLKYAPIIVNEKMEIIDGQHRYMAAKQLKKPVHYVIHQYADLELVPAINSKSTKWKTADYLNSYIDLKKPVYVALQDFVDHFKGVSIATAAKLFHSGSVWGGAGDPAMDAFREGTLKADHQDKAHDLAELLADFKPYTDNPFSSRMFRVIGELNGNGKYDHKLLLRKLEESGRRIENMENPKSIIQDMESIINHKSRNRIIIH
jgi:hypothetical protein